MSSAFQWLALTALAIIAISLWGIVNVLDKQTNRHLSNIADRLLDIENELRKRR